MKNVYIVVAKRTPMGSYGGSLSSFTAPQLGAFAIQGTLKAAGLSAESIDEVILGNVCSANIGQAPARQAALAAGLPQSVPCTTINKVCSSGMKSMMFGAMQIMTGQNEVVLCGGMESMSNVPYYVPKARWGYKYGDSKLVDGLARDGLVDAYDMQAMGVHADSTAEEYGISREDQDRFTIQSYERSAASADNGLFSDEIVPVSVKQRKGPDVIVSEDEEIRKVRFDKIPQLRPAFSKEGTVTAANASTINDGGAAFILASEEAIKKFNLTPMARIVAFADAAREPQRFTTAPVLAANKILKQSGKSLSDIDFFEVNEAFAVVTLTFNKEMGISEDQVNVNGGAVSLGHPLGASGARIVCTLNSVLKQKGAKTGLATLCNGGGGASAIIIERV